MSRQIRSPWSPRARPKPVQEEPAAPDATWIVTVEGSSKRYQAVGREAARLLACQLAEKNPGKTVRFSATPAGTVSGNG